MFPQAGWQGASSHSQAGLAAERAELVKRPLSFLVPKTDMTEKGRGHQLRPQ